MAAAARTPSWQRSLGVGGAGIGYIIRRSFHLTDAPSARAPRTIRRGARGWARDAPHSTGTGTARHGPARTLGWRLETAARPRTDRTAARDGGMTQHGTARHGMAARLDTARHCAALALHRTTPHRTASHHTAPHRQGHGTAGTARQSRHDTALHCGTARHRHCTARHGTARTWHGMAARLVTAVCGKQEMGRRRRAAATAPLLPRRRTAAAASRCCCHRPNRRHRRWSSASTSSRGGGATRNGVRANPANTLSAPLTSLSRPKRARRAQAAAAPAHSKW